MAIQRIERPLDGQQLAGPFRPVDWRAQEAFGLVAEGRAPSPPMHDGYVTRLTHYLGMRRIRQTVHGLSRLARRMPIPHRAVQFHEEASDGARCIAEALILANQPAEVVGQRVGLCEDALEFVEKCYFDVRDRLGRTDFIMDRVICLPAAGPIDERFAAATVKLLAYLTGPAAVDVLMPSRGSHWTSTADLAGMLARRARLLMDVHTLCRDWPADPQRKERAIEAIAAIEASPGPYGDESVPRTDAELLEAKQTLLDQILIDRLGGSTSPNREPNHVH